MDEITCLEMEKRAQLRKRLKIEVEKMLSPRITAFETENFLYSHYDMMFYRPLWRSASNQSQNN